MSAIIDRLRPVSPARNKEGKRIKMLKKFLSAFATVALVAALGAQSFGAEKKHKGASSSARVESPLNLAVLVQDDLVSRVGSELDVTREFIRNLPAGSRVLVGYLRAGSLQVRQPFTDDLAKAAAALRVPVASESAGPYNPYTQVVEALRHFEPSGKNRNAVLLVSDGLDVSRGYDAVSALNSIDLERAAREASRRNVAVYSFYAPTVGLTDLNSYAAHIGQSSLARLSQKTGGEAFFQGTSFVTFDGYFERLGRTLNARPTAAY
jgi:hypothetical protein